MKAIQRAAAAWRGPVSAWRGTVKVAEAVPTCPRCGGLGLISRKVEIRGIVRDAADVCPACKGRFKGNRVVARAPVSPPSHPV